MSKAKSTAFNKGDTSSLKSESKTGARNENEIFNALDDKSTGSGDNNKNNADNKVLVKQIEELVEELKRLETENDKLKDKYEHRIGTSMDSMQRVKEELDRARATNRFLVENAETRKGQCAKLETQNFELKMKIESLKKQFTDMTKTNVELAGEVNELLKERLDFQKVVDENERLKSIVQKYNIDVNTGRIISKVAKRRAQLTEKSANKGQSSDTLEKNKPVTERLDRSDRRNKTVRSAKSLEDIRSQDKSGTSNKPMTVMESPRGSYLGLHYKTHKLDKQKHG